MHAVQPPAMIARVVQESRHELADEHFVCFQVSFHLLCPCHNVINNSITLPIFELSLVSITPVLGCPPQIIISNQDAHCLKLTPLICGGTKILQ